MTKSAYTVLKVSVGAILPVEPNDTKLWTITYFKRKYTFERRQLTLRSSFYTSLLSEYSKVQKSSGVKSSFMALFQMIFGLLNGKNPRKSTKVQKEMASERQKSTFSGLSRLLGDFGDGSMCIKMGCRKIDKRINVSRKSTKSILPYKMVKKLNVTPFIIWIFTF